MLRTPFLYVSAATALLILIVLGGCLGRSQPARFYMLSPITGNPVNQAAGSQPANVAVGIGPIKVADYLDQSRIVTRTGDNVIKQAEFDQWAGTLSNNLTNVLAENIGHLLPTGQVYVYPWRTYIPIDYRILVDIIRFDGQPGGEAVLIASWSVLTGGENDLIATQRSDIREKTNGAGYQAYVAAQSRLLGRLSREIVEEIRAGSVRRNGN